ncbi:integrase, catalytic region, zinc finger, CCHC-type containing protein [Tanacetum coccineum]
MKAEALKEQTTTSRPIKALMMYPPNTPATLIPRLLPTKSQVKINIFALIQLFLEFEKTYKKRITPTGLTKGERGFEQTKKFYLTEVIPFFKTLKDHFKGIQKALTKEIKEMKEIFEELEAGVDQNVVNRKHDEIELKNLLIANDNLICSIKYQNLKKVLETTLLTRSDALILTRNSVKPRVLAPGKYAIDVEPIPPLNRNNRKVHLGYLKHLKESVETLREIIEEAKVERPLDSSLAYAFLYTKHSQELLEYVIGTYHVMSSSSTVTYTSVYTNSEPGIVFWGADEELSDGGYCGRLDLAEDSEEDPEEHHTDYHADGGDDDDEPSDDDDDDDDEPSDDDDDDDDTDDEDKEPFEDEEEEEHLALADSSVVPVTDVVCTLHIDHLRYGPLCSDTSTLGTKKTVDLSHLCHHPWRHVLLYAVAPTPLSPPPSPLSPWSSLLPQIPSPQLPPLPSSLHYTPCNQIVSICLISPTTTYQPPPLSYTHPVDHKEDIPKAELPPRKRLCLTAPTSRYEVGESSTAAPRPTRGHRADYGFISTTDANVRCQRAEEVGNGIRDLCVDPTEAV